MQIQGSIVYAVSDYEIDYDIDSLWRIKHA